MPKKSRPVIVDLTRSPYPVGSEVSAMASVARRAKGGKFAMVERGASQAFVVSMDPEQPDVAQCDTVELRRDDSDEKKVLH